MRYRENHSTANAISLAVVILIAFIGIWGLSVMFNQPPLCRNQDGTPRCETNDKRRFTSQSPVVGQEIVLYLSGGGYHTLNRCFVDKSPVKGTVTKGIVYPTEEDKRRLGYPPCPVPDYIK